MKLPKGIIIKYDRISNNKVTYNLTIKKWYKVWIKLKFLMTLKINVKFNWFGLSIVLEGKV